MQKKKIAHFGAFDHSSYGDLLFPSIAEHFLPEYEVIHVAPTRIPSGWRDARPIISVQDALERTDWDGILIGGGDIIQTGDWSTEKWKRHFETPFCSLPSLWAGACFLSAKLAIPLAWNSPGVPAPFEASYGELAELALEASDYIAVRDKISANNLSPYTNRSIFIVPDSALMLRQVWRSKRETTGHLVVSIAKNDIAECADEIKSAFAYFRKSYGGKVKIEIVQLMPWEFEIEDYEETLRLNGIEADIIYPLSIEATVEAIATAVGYIGNSLHGLVTAIAYGVPAVLVTPARKQSHKYEGFLRASGLNVSLHLSSSWMKAIELVAVQPKPEISKTTAADIDSHWACIQATLESFPTGKNLVWYELSQIVHKQGEDLALSGMSPYYFRNKTRSVIYQLSNTISEREAYLNALIKESSVIGSQISCLNQVVTERDGQISSLNQTVTERDGQTKSLSRAVAEREDQISGLNQTVAERDVQIAVLNQAVAERDGQISGLNQTVAERDVQIAGLNRTVAERDGQIGSLTEETVRRGEWALRLDAELKEEHAKLLSIIQSHSWRVTKPLREARRWISAPKLQAKRYVAVALRLAKRTYQALPLSAQTRAGHRNLLARYLPRALLLSGSPRGTIPLLSIPEPSQTLTTDVLEVSDAQSICIQIHERPLVSVIIPVYGKVDYTLRCLASISAHAPKAAYEVIVVDDCSPDNSVELLAKVDGIHLVRNAENQGFIRSCNLGAKAAKGEYLLFLNNDTQVTAGWLDELVRTFDEFPGTGLAGSKLIYPDGRLQEAGGIIWQDGSAWNFGRFQDPSLPVYNYAREVDYCSGASIMVPKSLFNELGGFDEHYLPAYCEDSDLALKIRDKGYRVIYQPLSTVIHFEGITSGKDTTQGTKAYQVENSKKLFKRWQPRLQQHQANGTDVDKAKDRKACRRVLVLDHCTPTPNQDAGSVTVFNLLMLLREMDFQVTFIPEDNYLYMPEYTTALQRAGIEVLYAPYVTTVEQHLKDYGNRYDLAFLFRPGVVERHLKAIRKFCLQAKVLFHTVDLHFLRMSREAELQSDKTKQKAADEMKQRELAAIRAVDASIVHSTAELDILRPLLPEAKLHVFPLIMDIKGTSKTFGERRDIVFVGGYQHTPNVDAVQYFAEEIMPLLRKQLPGVHFYAVGSKPPAEIQALASEDIIITGFVEDLTPFLDKMRVSVAPLRYGAGIKGKIGTAMAVGLPVVATSLAAEGMSLTDGENILVADGSFAIANTIVKIYEDEYLWSRISQNGLYFSEQAWGAEEAWRILAAILLDIGIQAKRSAHMLSLYLEK